MSDIQKPSIGRVVHYRLSEQDIENFGDKLNGGKSSNPPGTIVAAVVTAAWSPETPPQYCNMRLFTDNDQALPWATSRSRGDEPGQWNWPPRM